MELSLERTGAHTKSLTVKSHFPKTKSDVHEYTLLNHGVDERIRTFVVVATMSLIFLEHNEMLLYKL